MKCGENYFSPLKTHTGDYREAAVQNWGCERRGKQPSPLTARQSPPAKLGYSARSCTQAHRAGAIWRPLTPRGIFGVVYGNLLGDVILL